jgi:hypothetical protein
MEPSTAGYDAHRDNYRKRFFAEVNKRAKRFTSDEQFTVDGTLIQACASQKSFAPGMVPTVTMSRT